MSSTHIPTSESLLRNLDALVNEKHPLPPHALTQHDEHVRELYAATLAAVLLIDGAMSESQSRLFSRLIAAIGMPSSEHRLFERVEYACSKEGLRELSRVLESNSLVSSFLVDAFVICRIESPLGKTAAHVLSELIAFLAPQETVLSCLVDLSLIILGIPCERELPEHFDYTPFQVWDDFTCRELTAERLCRGVAGGRWKISSDIKIENGWCIENTYIRFINSSKLNSFATKEDVITLLNSTIDNPVFEFHGAKTVVFESVRCTGSYAEIDKTTSIKAFDVSGFWVSNSYFSTTNARSIFTKDCKSWFGGTKFIGCGNRLLIGGAIGSIGSKLPDGVFFGIAVNPIQVTDCSFDDCIASIGGAIRANSLGKEGITKSSFLRCTSKSFPPGDGEKIGGGAVFVDSVLDQAINSSDFVSCSIRFESFLGNYSYAIYSSNFKNGFIATREKACNRYRDCKFQNTGDDYINTTDQAQSWWSQYE